MSEIMTPATKLYRHSQKRPRYPAIGLYIYIDNILFDILLGNIVNETFRVDSRTQRTKL